MAEQLPELLAIYESSLSLSLSIVYLVFSLSKVSILYLQRQSNHGMISRHISKKRNEEICHMASFSIQVGGVI